MDTDAQRELASILAQLLPEDRQYLANLSEDQTFLIYRGFGAHVRNEVRRGKLPALFAWSRTQASAEATHFDDVTSPILPALIRAAKKQLKEGETQA